jgi:16S rRNA (adenine1518-N6/adenine1519-N6)-dimethyltransferase
VGQRLGQHFLVKGSILERIAAAACPDHVELVVEIGPGRGALTERLLARASRVAAIELDPYLVDHLRRRFPDRLEVIHQDVLAADLSRWPGVPIVGNLPYYITSPILEKVVRLDFPRAVFLMQKEVAERLTASPGSRDYGFLTVQTAVYARARLLFAVKPTAFHPPPKVDSAVVLLEPQSPLVSDPNAFIAFAGACFRQKRKTLRNNLAGLYAKDLVDALPEAGLRAEQLPVAQLVDLYERLRRPVAAELHHPEA